MDIGKYISMGGELLIIHGPKLVFAIITLVVGFRVINIIQKLVVKTLAKYDVDKTLRPFLGNLVNWSLKIMLSLSVAQMVGIETTSFVAIIGTAGFAVGFALKSSLGNFAGGIMILLFKPYKVGDFIETQGYTGTVKTIKIFVTELSTVQNRAVYIPNGPISEGSITNFTKNETVRVDLVIGVSYDADIKQVKNILLNILKNDERTLNDPEQTVTVGELADSSVNFNVRAWVKTPDYWDVHSAVLEQCKLQLDDAGISIPYPQTDINLYNKNNNA